MVGIYKITNNINGKVYIGQSVDIEKRWTDHKSASKTNNSIIYRAMRKYGIENFSFEIIEECSIEDLDSREVYYIELYNSYIGWENHKGYNATLGGGGSRGCIVTEETRRKLSECRKGLKHHFYGKHMSEEHRRKLSEAKKGKKLTQEHINNILESRGEIKEETREKLRKSHLGLRHSEEAKEKMRGRTLSEETKKKMSESKLNMTEQTKNKIGKAKSKPIICDGMFFNSLKECADFYKIGRTTMTAWLSGQNTMKQKFVDMNLHFATEEELLALGQAS